MNILFGIAAALAIRADARCVAPNPCFDVVLRVSSCKPLKKSNLLIAREIRRTATACDSTDGESEPYEVRTSSIPRKFVVPDCASYQNGATVLAREQKPCCDTIPATVECMLDVPLLTHPGPYCEGTPLNLDGIVGDRKEEKAIVNGEVLAKGDRFRGGTVIDISPNGLSLNCGGRKIVLGLER